ncbi:AEC family transporter [Methanobrevibacter millerae]|uniref:Transporter n=1 Tax=Methanobrevibacter millerae TaxID=230361 RepID=A0A1G5XP89_9EURY|nr:AEC family transporter [Methanobrevibacter millerae]SDA72142.1 hypothetical protein SAMN02910315_02394 [Methanobrevibacter millerae]
MASPIEVILIPALMILFGYFLKYISFIEQSDRELLSKIVLYVALPSLIFINLHDATVTMDMLSLPVIGLCTSLILFGIAFIYCKVRNYSKRTTWTILMAASIMNTGFIGYPVSMGVFGNEGLLNAIFFDLSTTIMVIAYGVLLAKEFGGEKPDIIKNILKFTPLWAVIFALIFNFFNIPIPYVAESILTYFGQATIPLIMLCMGLSLEFTNIGQNLSDSLVVSVIKLIFAPAIVFFMMMFLNIKGMAFNIGILEAGMSTAMNALVLSIEYDLDSDLMSSLIFTNVILSVFTLTAIITLLTG